MTFFFSAFAKLPIDVVEHLVNNPSILRQVLLYHVATGTWYSKGLEEGMSLTSLESGKLPVHITDGNLILIYFVFTYHHLQQNIF